MKHPFKVLLIIDLSESYCRGLLSGLAKYANMHGNWMFCRMPMTFKEINGIDGIIKWAKKWNADGIVALLPDEQEVFKLIKSGIPVIAQDANERFSQIPNITGDYHKTGELAADYFLERGYKNFAYYGPANMVWSRERKEGFEKKLIKEGYEVHYQDISQKQPEMWTYKPSPLSKWLKGLPKPLAVYCCDDNQAQNVTEACRIANLYVPEEVSILGTDNDDTLCMLSQPPLSSISLNTEKGGYETGELLHKMMLNSKTKIYDVVVEPTHVITRKSTDILAIKDREVAKALRFIFDNYNKHFTVKDILAKVPLSRRALEKRFKKEMGRTLHLEIQRVRIEEFAKRLIETNRSVLEIAIELGFDDNKNISRIFQKIKKMTPLQFRRNFGRN